MRVELVDVYCRDTEDLLVADIFYVMSAAISCDADKTVLLTDPINIKTDETISFSGHDLAVSMPMLLRTRSCSVASKLLMKSRARTGSKSRNGSSKSLKGCRLSGIFRACRQKPRRSF